MLQGSKDQLSKSPCAFFFSYMFSSDHKQVKGGSGFKDDLWPLQTVLAVRKCEPLRVSLRLRAFLRIPFFVRSSGPDAGKALMDLTACWCFWVPTRGCHDRPGLSPAMIEWTVQHAGLPYTLQASQEACSLGSQRIFCNGSGSSTSCFPISRDGSF